LLLGTGNRYTPDFFTPDAWNCQLEDYIVSPAESSRLENLCVEGTAARTMSLALTVLSAVVLYGVLWRTYRRHQAAQNPPSRKALHIANSVRSIASDERTVIANEVSEKGA
jgi:hypothetical protein